QPDESDRATLSQHAKVLRKLHERYESSPADFAHNAARKLADFIQKSGGIVKLIAGMPDQDETGNAEGAGTATSPTPGTVPTTTTPANTPATKSGTATVQPKTLGEIAVERLAQHIGRISFQNLPMLGSRPGLKLVLVRKEDDD